MVPGAGAWPRAIPLPSSDRTENANDAAQSRKPAPLMRKSAIPDRSHCKARESIIEEQALNDQVHRPTNDKLNFEGLMA